jgi:hypothetical protein
MLHYELLRAIHADHERTLERELRERRQLRAEVDAVGEPPAPRGAATVSTQVAPVASRSACAPSRSMTGSPTP